MSRRISSAACLAFLQIVTIMIWSQQVEAQITIDRAWLEAQVGQHTSFFFDLGNIEENPLTSEDEAHIQDIIDNRTGPNQTYDLRGLPFEAGTEFTARITGNVDELAGSDNPAFASANYGSVSFFRDETEEGTIEGTANGFFELNDGALLLLGTYVETNEGPFTFTYSPPDSQYALPLTDGTAWTSTTRQSFSGFDFDQSSSAVVEGYGTLLLPGGIDAEALRIKRIDETSFMSIVSVSITYEFQTREGHVATINQFQAEGDPEPTLAGVSYSTTSATTAIEAVDGLPQVFMLEQNYPNPFNPSTTLDFALTESGHAKLEVFDMVGRRVATLVDNVLPAGKYVVRFDAHELTSGTYFYRLTTDMHQATRAMLLVR